MTQPLNRKMFTDEEYDKVVQYMVGGLTRYRDNIIIPRNMGPVTIKAKEEKMVERFFESCAFKAGMSCVLGNFTLTRKNYCLFNNFCNYCLGNESLFNTPVYI